MADVFKPNDIFIATSDLQSQVTNASEGKESQITDYYTVSMMNEGMTGDNT